MNEEIKQRVASCLNHIESIAAQAGDIAAEQLPIAAWEVVSYHRLRSSIGVFVGVILLIVGFGSAIKACKLLDGTNYRGESQVGARVVAAVVTMIPGAAITLDCLDTFVMSWVAPRILIIKEIGNLYQ